MSNLKDQEERQEGVRAALRKGVPAQVEELVDRLVRSAVAKVEAGLADFGQAAQLREGSRVTQTGGPLAKITAPGAQPPAANKYELPRGYTSDNEPIEHEGGVPPDVARRRRMVKRAIATPLISYPGANPRGPR